MTANFALRRNTAIIQHNHANGAIPPANLAKVQILMIAYLATMLISTSIILWVSALAVHNSITAMIPT